MKPLSDYERGACDELNFTIQMLRGLVNIDKLAGRYDENMKYFEGVIDMMEDRKERILSGELKNETQ